MNSEVANLKSFLLRKLGIDVFDIDDVLDIWLEETIAWCKKVVLGPNYTAKELRRNIYEQSLLIDLRDLERPCLPPKLSSREDFTLNGKFFLQVMELVDISKPKLWQLQRIRNERVLTKSTQQESDTVATGKRKLQLTLSDGVQEVEAIENSPIPSLSINLLPGAKIRVSGPVVVRRGRLMLEQQNVKVFGGNVEKLLVSNHPENVLARSLKLPENPKPGKIDEKVLSGEADKEEAIMTVCDVNEPKPFTNNHLPPNRPFDSTTRLPNCRSNDRPKRPNQSSIVPAASYVMTDEQERLCRKLNRLLKDARSTKYSPPKKTNTQDFDKLVTSTLTNSTDPPKEDKFVPQNVDDDYVFNDMDIDAHPDKILMLERQNVKVFGGDVEKLLVSNHPENVLARSLKLPENPNPGKIDEKVLYGEVDKEEAIMTVRDVNEPKPFTNNHLPPKRPYQSSILPTDASSDIMMLEPPFKNLVLSKKGKN